MLTLAQVEKVIQPPFAHWPQILLVPVPQKSPLFDDC